jgi:hypothetical protein
MVGSSSLCIVWITRCAQETADALLTQAQQMGILTAINNKRSWIQSRNNSAAKELD